MLSKSQFKSAVARLQKELTPSHISHMLKKAFERTNQSLTPEEDAFISSLEVRLTGENLLDRRRCENYLAKSLYGQNHSEIAHKLTNDKSKHERLAEILARKYELYGGLLSVLNPNLSGNSYIADKLKSDWHKLVQSTIIENFNISNTKFETLYYDQDYKIDVRHAAALIHFKDVAIEIEVIYCINPYCDAENWPISESINMKVNGLDVLDYMQAIYSQATKYDADCLESLIFEFIWSKMDADFARGGTFEYTSNDKAITENNFNFILRDGFNLNYLAKNTILQSSLILFRISEIKKEYFNLIYKDSFACSTNQKVFDVVADGWVTDNSNNQLSGYLKIFNDELSVEIEYFHVFNMPNKYKSGYLILKINGETVINDDFNINENLLRKESCNYISDLIKLHPFLELLER